jgi:hypothetical protein
MMMTMMMMMMMVTTSCTRRKNRQMHIWLRCHHRPTFWAMVTRVAGEKRLLMLISPDPAPPEFISEQ